MTTLALNPDGAYENDADTWVQAPQLDLSAATGTVLTFRLIGSSQESSDVLYLDVSTDASTWSTPPLKVGSSTRYNGISGTVPHFTTVSTDLGQWDGAPRFHLRFRFQSDADTNADGFYIDDIVLQAAGEQDSYQYMQGTSMAAGFVTGIAALIQSENDTMTPSQIRTLIEDSADRIDDLMDVTVTGGRVNAHQALALQNGSSLPDSSLEGASSGGGGGGGGCFISSIRTGP